VRNQFVIIRECAIEIIILNGLRDAGKLPTLSAALSSCLFGLSVTVRRVQIAASGFCMAHIGIGRGSFGCGNEPWSP